MEDTMQTVDILGVRISDIGLNGYVSYILSCVSQGKKALVFTPNAEALFLCSEDKATLEAFCSADLCIPDGDGVILASRLLKSPIKCGKVAGIELGELLISKAASDKTSEKENGHSVYLLGGKPGVAEKAAKKLCEKYPGLRIAGFRDGYFSSAEEGGVIRDINASGADILFVCLGMPRQEIWASKNRDRLVPCAILCLGGSLDIYSGLAKRAPKIIISMHLEWLWRLLCNPGRFVRVMRIPRFIFRVLKSKKTDA